MKFDLSKERNLPPNPNDEKESYLLRQRVLNGSVKIKYIELRNYVEDLYNSKYGWSKTHREMLGVNRINFTQILECLGYERDDIETFREVNTIRTMIYGDSSTARLNLSELLKVLTPILMYKSFFDDVISNKKQRRRPLEQLEELTATYQKDLPSEARKIKATSADKESIPRISWTSHILEYMLLSWPDILPQLSEEEFEKKIFVPSGIDEELVLVSIRKHKRLINSIDKPGADLMDVDVKVFQCICKRLHARNQAQHFFQTFANKRLPTSRSKEPRKIHQSRNIEAAKFIFQLPWWENRDEIKALSNYVWRNVDRITEHQFITRISDYASYHSARQTYVDSFMGKTNNHFDLNMLPVLVEIHMWGRKPSSYCLGELHSLLTMKYKLDGISWLETLQKADDLLLDYQTQQQFLDIMNDSHTEACDFKMFVHDIVENIIHQGALKYTHLLVSLETGR